MSIGKKKGKLLSLSSGSEIGHPPDLMETLERLPRGQNSWEGKVQYLIKGIVIAPISLAWLKVDPEGWSLGQAVDLPN